jgi:hypothetical protein
MTCNKRFLENGTSYMPYCPNYMLCLHSFNGYSVDRPGSQIRAFVAGAPRTVKCHANYIIYQSL